MYIPNDKLTRIDEDNNIHPQSFAFLNSIGSSDSYIEIEIKNDTQLQLIMKPSNPYIDTYDDKYWKIVRTMCIDYKTARRIASVLNQYADYIDNKYIKGE